MCNLKKLHIYEITKKNLSNVLCKKKKYNKIN